MAKKQIDHRMASRRPAALLLLLVASSSAALIFFLILPSFSSPPLSPETADFRRSKPDDRRITEQISPTSDDINWLNSQFQENSLPDPSKSPQSFHSLRKGINPRTRQQQLDDLLKFKGISHYSNPGKNHTALLCPGELLVEEHHSNYGEPWAGGRDVFEFLASAISLRKSDSVLEIGCGTLRAGLHFIRYLDPGRYSCVERDEISLLAALRYEIPSQGLIHKRPRILRGDDMDFSRFGGDGLFDLVYASAVFLHVPDRLVWVGLEGLASKVEGVRGRIFVSHNIKFCTRIKEECWRRLEKIGLEYVGNHTHDSLLFDHYEIWFEFRKVVK